MKKNVFNWMLATAMVLSLGITVTSCSDDDEPQSEEEKELEAQQKATKFWSVVGQLVSVDDATEDYEGKTFEATYGIADPTNATVRIVNTNDMKTAAQRFANLVDDDDINENTTTYTWSDPEIGTMTYTRGGTAAEWATVDVNIKAVPGLQKIIYREGGEGDNGKFSGKAYYRFGDVVSRQVEIKYHMDKNDDPRKTITEYWICVRPAFGPEGKEDSHWVCVNTVSDKNYKYYKASNGYRYWLPTALKTDKENMQNFAEMLYAICNPQTWFDNVFNHHTDGKLWGFDGVPFFTDFKGANLKYHNQYFWQNVSTGWDKFKIAEKALNLDNIEALSRIVNRQFDGVRLLYNGYSWWFTTSWNCELWEAVYTSGTKDEELNMHHAEYNNPEQNMKERHFDVREMGKKLENYKDFFQDDNIRWVIRHATGKELASNKKFDVKLPIEGVKEEYRYYRDMVPTTDLTDQPETTTDVTNRQYKERGYFDMCDVVKDEQGNRWFCIQPSGYKQDVDFLKNYAYFVSFDEGAVGKNLEHIPSSKKLIMQMLYDMDVLRHNLINKGGSWPRLSTNTKDYAGIDIEELLPLRDSTVTHAKYGTKDRELNDFLSVLYRENDQLHVFRFIADYVHDDSDGGRVWKYFYSTNYSKGPTRPMLLSDLANQEIINQYNEDPWVRNTWYISSTKQKVYTNMGPRTQPEPITPLTRFIYKLGYSALDGSAPANMYREPLYAFAVKRVSDTGTRPTTFEDGTKIYPVRLMKEVSDSYYEDEPNAELDAICTTYRLYGNTQFYLDNELCKIGMDN